MSLRLEMLQVARLAPRVLLDASPLIANFLRSRLNDDGGFQGRDGRSDLYYTVFGIEGLLALQEQLPYDQIAHYLRSFDHVDSLDMVHTAALARCWAGLPAVARSAAPHDAIIERIESFRTSDGGYAGDDEGPNGTVYGCFLALGAYQDVGRKVPDPQTVLTCIDQLRGDDGGFTNHPAVPHSLTPPTAAAVTIMRHLGRPLERRLAEWFLSRLHPEGGFFATPMAPLPDLLSTATALHALAQLHVDPAPLKEACLDFIDTLWTNRGGFHGTWEDDVVDTEYTYYGLLALGHLSL